MYLFIAHIVTMRKNYSMKHTPGPLETAVKACYAYANTHVPNGGNAWLDAFDSEVERQGLTFDQYVPCKRQERGEFGHEPECGLIAKTTK